MPETCDILNADVLKNKIKRDIEIIYYPSVDSTNTRAKHLINEGKKNKMLLVADEQTNGRGRQGKHFFSPAKSGIYMSYVFHPMKNFASTVTVTTAASVAVCKAIESLTDKKPEIKWVNDVYLGGKKICGILCEAISDYETGKIKSVIIGIGINITTADFPEYVENASCLGVNIKRADLIAEVTKELEKIVFCDYNSFIDYYRAHSMVIGKDVCFTENGVKTNARALAIEDDGALVVELENKERKTLRSGEISLGIAR
ncbi:MAG: biotin--[Eubacterium sp.]|nr:biotin--[acetyl-CoA-carboxylase] ligase [Eubacterium sp.]